jgi:ABC-2 type transport system ATP-binding protein
MTFADFRGLSRTIHDETMTPAIETNALVKHFGATRAVDGIDLRVARGAVYGLLGPNGAGKTTTIRVLTTLLRPDGGSARVLGHDVAREPAAVRAKVSLTGQFASVDEDLTGHENLVLVSRLFGYSWKASRARAGELLAAFDLSDSAAKQVRTYSGGMRRRLDIAASLVVTPEILFLDEPTTGLDPRSRNQVWDIVRSIAAGGTTVLLTTQYLEEADRLADRLAVIDHGRLIAEGTSRELKSSVGSNTLHVRIDDAARMRDAERLLRQALGDGVHEGGETGTLSARVEGESRIADALAALASAGIGVAELTLGQPSLDDVFFALTGKPSEPTTAALPTPASNRKEALA